MINSLRETMTLPVRNLPVSQRDHSSIGNIELLNQMGTIDARAKIALRCICLCKYPAITSYQHLIKLYNYNRIYELFNLYFSKEYEFFFKVVAKEYMAILSMYAYYSL